MPEDCGESELEFNSIDPQLTPQRAASWMAEELVMARVDDMKSRADLLTIDGQEILAKAATIRAEAMRLENDLYKFKCNHPDLFPDR